METFEGALSSLINRYSIEGESNTPDVILAEYMCGCLHAFNKASQQREKWHVADSADIPPEARRPEDG